MPRGQVRQVSKCTVRSHLAHRATPLPSPAGASFLPPNARNPLAPPVRGGLQGGGDKSAPLLGGGGGGGQQQQALMVPAQDQYLASRAEALHQVGVAAAAATAAGRAWQGCRSPGLGCTAPA